MRRPNNSSPILARATLLLLVAGTLASLTGCQALYMLGGKGEKEALYKLPEKSRVLIMVDPRASSNMPIDAPAVLGEKISQHLFTYKAATNFVAQSRLTDLRKDDTFRQMGIADVARKLDADVVVFIDVLHFGIQEVSEGQVSQGDGQVLVKVVDRDGKRLWPAETAALGAPVEARVAPNFMDQSSPNAVKDQLLKQITIRVGRIFHNYDMEDKNLNQ